MLDPLLSHGPAAVDRVHGRLDEIAGRVQAEQAAFAAFSEEVRRQSGAAVPTGAQLVDELRAARTSRARAAHADGMDDLSVEQVLQQIDRRRGPRIPEPKSRRRSDRRGR